eukprot:TRINITY_DN8193_c0_g1::TRINITY_DN8193_c0_g1_i1::g.7222::m.7222 TRINITY_DN8193_c0_g1::TRINITY_DN8193_c0_g1_i1::g.7222  ORF type:complete len:264 (+),score=15.28,sp/O15442/MPPD1_HUMAN/46.40/4e-74,Metallophos/PF00149.23/4.5e-11,Metallophos_2/PF12850.2/5.4e-09 TRINITY_DN8193_c0_g1_i1:200-991(+)
MSSEDATDVWNDIRKAVTVRAVEPIDPYKVAKRPGYTRVVCISDTHSLTEQLTIPPGDLLIHAGDFTNIGHPDDVFKFAKFLDTLPHPHKLVVPGNHDFIFDQKMYPDLWPRFHRVEEDVGPCLYRLRKSCRFLIDETVIINGYKFYGSPWSPTYGPWGFGLDRGEPIMAKWSLIPRDVDILITHGPPLGHGDFTNSRKRAGCFDLLCVVEELAPQYHVFGHIHEGHGMTTNGKTVFVNAATCNVRYKPVNHALVFDLPPRIA